MKLKRLPKLKGMGSMDAPRLAMPDAREAVFDLTDDELDRITLALRDSGLAKRVQKLMRQFPQGTIPELVTYDWLTRQKVDFQYQVALYGGRSRRGGIIPDFVLYRSGGAMAWQVQGNYWHNRAGRPANDAAQRMRLLATRANGQSIRQVIFLWESRILNDRPRVFEMALANVELGP